MPSMVETLENLPSGTYLFRLTQDCPNPCKDKRTNKGKRACIAKGANFDVRVIHEKPIVDVPGVPGIVDVRVMERRSYRDGGISLMWHTVVGSKNSDLTPEEIQ